jgi:hypothetical protein
MIVIAYIIIAYTIVYKTMPMQKLKMAYLNKTSVLCIMLLCGFQLSAQTLEDDEQEIIKDFEAQLEDAQRVIVKPTLQPVVVSKKTYKYDVTIIPLELRSYHQATGCGA